MNAHDAIRSTIESGSNVAMAYLDDLTDADLLHRPAPACNHINWQVGHLIVAEHEGIAKVLPGAMPPLPPGFTAKYMPDKAKLDDPAAFCNKAELLRVQKEQRTAALAALAKLSAADLDKPCEGWTPTVGTLFIGVAGTHWLMHVGQWAIVRRQLGRPPLF